MEVYATYYGWYDNTPPGCATAYSGCARGTGTYADPITFASDKKEFPVGTRLYYPTVEKYFRMGDDCQECDLDWSGHGPDGGPRFHHVDLWIGGQGGNEFDAINCEDGLTQGLPDGSPLTTPFIEDPPRGLPVSMEPLFDTRTGHCFGGATTSSTTGRYRDKATGTCLADTTGGTAGPVTVAPCGPGASDRIVYDGAFLVHGQQCLETSGGRDGSKVVWADCNGNDREQWEVNPDGTITWVQYTRCLAPSGHGVVMTACTGRAAERWLFHRE
ncbi:MAG TPA: RICIN domain-containing protein [Acidimicrobiales bacterium]|nr:RICIN domain-containing protein [Acidimicrobiales bacterium]